ncbi:Alpha/Beta hydrolase protein [Mycotypha africana]|uniref:Alpha/Beta hydrolase protein n=1 Tax=Mycotypha africana TaxID=64632 RepID=UPI002301A7F1|nr:Alpha/Beta hydrolase protein [Mycotypha africana]KAI8991995.1 Alpha/Beta hydrolase protein [Mycotypha africana]
MVLLSHALEWLGYIPLIVSYLHWRYWQYSPKSFKQFVSLDIPYNEHSKLDVYHPNKISKNKSTAPPIIIFIYGGGWGSGSKLIYSTLANTLREMGYVIVLPDYRKYPEGHSAGAHLAASVILRDLISRIIYEKAPHTTSKSANISQNFLPLVEGLLLFSGVYDIAAHFDHETSRGIEKLSAMARAMGSNREGYIANSPLYMVQENQNLFTNAADLLHMMPRILLLHGQKDSTVGMEQSTRMFNMLGTLFSSKDREQVDVRMRLYKRMGHSEPVLALMRNLFTERPEQKLLLRDIKEFVDGS